jgi:hypothetical protein
MFVVLVLVAFSGNIVDVNAILGSICTLGLDCTSNRADQGLRHAICHCPICSSVAVVRDGAAI